MSTQRPHLPLRRSLPVFRRGITDSNTPKGTAPMNKLIVALVASFFAIASFAASHAGAPMAGASAPAAAASGAKSDKKAAAKKASAKKASTKKTTDKTEKK